VRAAEARRVILHGQAGHDSVGDFQASSCRRAQLTQIGGRRGPRFRRETS
jgi:hypothetical protein